jgi:hypothetical protein
MRIFKADKTHTTDEVESKVRDALEKAAEDLSLERPADWDGEALESTDVLIVHHTDLVAYYPESTVLFGDAGPRVLRISGAVPERIDRESRSRVEYLYAPIGGAQFENPSTWEEILRYFRDGGARPAALVEPSRREALAVTMLARALELVALPQPSSADEQERQVAEAVREAKTRWSALSEADRNAYLDFLLDMASRSGEAQQKRITDVISRVKRGVQ